LYTRPTCRSDSGQLWDEISRAPMSTEFAISRFFTPLLAKFQGWALFMDADVLVRSNLIELFNAADSTKAVMCVQHAFDDASGTKMDGQLQVPYPRKNWSSVMLFNCAHPANAALTPQLLNSVPGRDLHRFCWLEDDQIGALDPAWNWLVGHSDPAIAPKIVHFTDGFPLMPGYESQAYADEWRDSLVDWASAR
jgi:lipopolysaccharide biosynthesis glycosyltransferase